MRYVSTTSSIENTLPNLAMASASALIATLALLLLLLLSCLAGPSDAAGTAALQVPANCSGNYSSTDAYAANLYQLLAALPETTVTKNGGFFNGTVGAPGAPGTAYGLALCSADYERSDCLDCLTTAINNASGMPKQCPGSSRVMAMYDQCLLHYSDAEFAGTEYTDIKYVSRGTSTPKQQIDYSQDLGRALVNLNAEAADSPKRFAANKASPFVLAQCTWDLAPTKCKECLDLLAPNISQFMGIKSTGEIRTYSCRVRHSEVSFPVYPFVNVDANTTSDHEYIHDHEQSTRNRTVIAVVVSVGVVLAMLLVAAVVVFRRRRRARLAGSITMNGTSVRIDHLKDYTYEELKKATGGFSKDSELGRGAFGVVYKGTLPDGKVLAVKKLQRTEKVEVEQFMNEVSILSGLKHKNLVKLEGYCIHQGTEGLLCYEYLPDGTLEDRLHGGGDGKTKKMSWRERHHVLVGICRGLQYLHDESPNDISIMHMDLKTDNILLQVQEQPKGTQEDKIITPKISDFGISRNLQNDKQHEYVVQVVGNASCVPREFIERGKASTKVDIYSFGLIILEMVTGKPRGSWSSTAQEKRHSEGFIKQVREHWEKKETINKLKDASMDSDCHHEIEKCIEIALECVREEPAMRPDIADVIRRLTDIGHFNKQQKS